MYGKIIEGTIEFAPSVLEGNGVTVYNPPASMYKAQGWKPVELTEQPEPVEGYYYVVGWSEKSTKIVRTWTKTPIPSDIPDSEALSIIMGGASE